MYCCDMTTYYLMLPATLSPYNFSLEDLEIGWNPILFAILTFCLQENHTTCVLFYYFPYNLLVCLPFAWIFFTLPVMFYFFLPCLAYTMNYYFATAYFYYLPPFTPHHLTWQWVTYCYSTLLHFTDSGLPTSRVTRRTPAALQQPARRHHARGARTHTYVHYRTYCRAAPLRPLHLTTS